VLLLEAATVLGKLVAQLATYRPINAPTTITAAPTPNTFFANRLTFDPPLTFGLSNLSQRLYIGAQPPCGELQLLFMRILLETSCLRPPRRPS
jgi:hypothetical protein